jgi:alpha-D-xyloside xylohydrolase
MGPHFVKIVDGGTLSIEAIGEAALRVRFEKDPSDVPTAKIVLGTSRPREIVRSDKDGVTRITAPRIVCEIDANGRIQFLAPDGRVLLAEAAGGRTLTQSKLGDDTVYIAEQAFEAPADERIFGTGCFQDGALNIRGFPRRLTQVNSQISLPFTLSSKGYGLLWHQPGMAEFNVPRSFAPLTQDSTGDAQIENVTTTSGNAEVIRRFARFKGSITIEADGQYAFLLDIGRSMGSRYRVDIGGVTRVDYANLWLPPTMSFLADLRAVTHEVIVEANDTDAPGLFFGPVTDTTVWRSPVAGAVDYIVIAGDDADAIMSVYRDLLGATPMLPVWAYGYVHCRERFHSSQEIIDTLDEFRRRKLPVDVMVQDWQYWGKYGWNAMRFDEDHYPDPALLVEELHKRDARLMLSVWSRIGRETELGKEVERRGYYIPDTEWIDFFNPDAVDFYCRMQEERLGKYGIDAWWQDATEPENDDLAGRMTAAGPGDYNRLTYPLQVSRAVYESRRKARPDERVAILTRCAFLGQQTTAAVTWSGDIGHDWETLRRQIPAGLNMAAAGYPYWTVDAGGFFRPGDGQFTDPAYRERFIRWFQYATFLPMQRVHGYQTNTEFWRYGEEVENVSRQYLELRYRLLPYIYSAAMETTRTGVPMLRPLVFDFAQDERALEEVHTYLFGRGIHVAPVTEPGVTQWQVYLPETPGGWYDLWTGQHREGGRQHNVPVTTETLPLHGRAGSIIPVGPVLQSTVEAKGDRLDVYVIPGRDAVFDLYEDQGLDTSYERGEGATIGMRWNDERSELEIRAREGSFEGMRDYKQLIIHKLALGHTPMTSRGGVSITYTGAAMTVKV